MSIFSVVLRDHIFRSKLNNFGCSGNEFAKQLWAGEYFARQDLIIATALGIQEAGYVPLHKMV